MCELTGGLDGLRRAIVATLYVSSMVSSVNVSAPVADRRQRESGSGLRAGFALLVAAAIAACAPPQPGPRSSFFFMEDGIAREGVLTRCNQNRDATLTDEECANARRAAAAIALEAERAREPELARESEAKLLALRQREARRAASEQDTAAAALADAEAAYEARWRNSPGNRSGDDPASSAPVAAFGVPLGPVMPSMTESSLFDVYAAGSDPLGRRSLEVAAAEPPANDFSIPSPDLELAELAIVPRPFRDDADTAPH
jgi:hypothetical protein